MADESTTNQPASPRLSTAAFNECFERYAGGIRAFLRARLVNEADVDDCFVTVFEKLWTHGANVSPTTRGAWLFVVARREAALFWRKSARREEVMNAVAVSDTERFDELSPDGRLIDEERRQDLERMIAELNGEQQEVLRRRFTENQSFKQIAEELQIPLGTALTRLHGALKRLRKRMQSDAGESFES